MRSSHFVSLGSILTIFGAMEKIIFAPASSMIWFAPRQPAGIR